ncbi:MAG: glycosyltransferase [Chloroflexi bacterium]|nr:glycosyltransferase [Chloroflexota bacterium]
MIDTCIQETARALGATNYEIIVVDDGSRDETRAHAQRAADSNSRVRVIHYQPNRGKGYALKHGYAQSEGERVLFLDADADLPPRQILEFTRLMDETHADVVIGSKMHPASKLEYPLLRRVVSWGYYRLAHFLFGLPVRDTQTGIKLFRREVLRRVLPRVQTDGFAFDLELLVAANLFGYKIIEAPVELNFDAARNDLARTLRASLAMARDTLRVFYRTSFWKWLSPGFAVKFWTILLAIGLVAAGVGIARVLNNFTLPFPLNRIMDLALLRFLDHSVRDALLLFGGAIVVLIALAQLNKHIVAAFSRREHSGFWEEREP